MNHVVSVAAAVTVREQHVSTLLTETLAAWPTGRGSLVPSRG